MTSRGGTRTWNALRWGRGFERSELCDQMYIFVFIYLDNARRPAREDCAETIVLTFDRTGRGGIVDEKRNTLMHIFDRSLCMGNQRRPNTSITGTLMPDDQDSNFTAPKKFVPFICF